MSEPKNQHFVPQFHLRNWCNKKDNNLQRVRWLPNGELESKRRSTKNVCNKIHLYSLKTANNAYNYAIEYFFTKLENEAAPIAQKLLNGISISSDKERTIWTDYLLAQRLRVKSELDKFYKNNRPIIEHELLQLQNDINKLHLKNLKKSFISDIKDNSEDITRIITLISMTNFLSDNGINQNILKNMKWHVVDTSNWKHNLLTSDQPIIYTAGLKETHTEVIFPLSPSKVFIACHGNISKKTNEIGRICNDQMVLCAQKIVIDYDDTQREFIKRRLRKN